MQLLARVVLLFGLGSRLRATSGSTQRRYGAMSLTMPGTSAVLASSRRSRKSPGPSIGHSLPNQPRPSRAKIRRPQPTSPAPHDTGPPSPSSSAAAASSSSSASATESAATATSDGSWRFSGRAFHTAARSASSSSARPRRVSFCLRVSQSRSERHQVIVGQLVVLLARLRLENGVGDRVSFPSGSVGVMRRISLSRMRIRSSKSLGRLA